MTAPRVRVNERHVLLWLLAGFVLAYGGAFLATFLRGPAERADTARRPVVAWMPPVPKDPTDLRYLAADMNDPSLLSLPSRHGFSAGLWRTEFTPQSRSLVTELKPAFLEPEFPSHDRVLLPVPSLTEKLVAALAARPLPRPPTLLDPDLPALAPGTQSVVSISGELADRPLITRPPLPVITNAAPLRGTVLQLAVAGDGTVRYAIPQRGCGVPAVDDQAQQLAYRLLFAPQSAGTQLQWGTARFEWLTVPPSP